MNSEKYIGLDVHQVTISVAVLDSKGKLVMESYSDNNFVVAAHDASEEYKTLLHELASSGKVRFVLSPWHWREMARDADHARNDKGKEIN